MRLSLDLSSLRGVRIGLTRIPSCQEFDEATNRASLSFAELFQYFRHASVQVDFDLLTEEEQQEELKHY